ncbi:hypothetical protein MBLNU230_g1280t1 [Neophaeotheca triangularis]
MPPPRPSSALPSTLGPQLSKPSTLLTRQRRTLSIPTASPPDPSTTAPNPRWLSETKGRVGKCILFGLHPPQAQKAGAILQQLARDWRQLTAGSEGFLTDRKRRGLFRQEVVWGEMDSMGHVNNVVYNRYAESGRVQWAQKIARFVDPGHSREWSELWTPRGTGMILRKITTEFKFPMKWPDHITIYHKLRTEPTESTDSFILDVLILSELHQRPAARIVEDIVVYDYPKAKKVALPPFMADVFKQTWKLQEEAKRRNSERVQGLLEQVRALEKETWDRDGAVEL